MSADDKLSPELEASTCTIQLIVQEVDIFFRGDQQTGRGVLVFPENIQVSGKLSKDEPLQKAAEVDSDMLLIIEGTLWLKGYPRLHAKMVSTLRSPRGRECMSTRNCEEVNQTQRERHHLSLMQMPHNRLTDRLT